MADYKSKKVNVTKTLTKGVQHLQEHIKNLDEKIELFDDEDAKEKAKQLRKKLIKDLKATENLNVKLDEEINEFITFVDGNNKAIRDRDEKRIKKAFFQLAVLLSEVHGTPINDVALIGKFWSKLSKSEKETYQKELKPHPRKYRDLIASLGRLDKQKNKNRKKSKNTDDINDGGDSGGSNEGGNTDGNDAGKNTDVINDGESTGGNDEE